MAERDRRAGGRGDDADVRAASAAWIAAHWNPDAPLRDWREQLAESGWGCPSWPSAWFGRDLPAGADAIVADELARAGAVGPPVGAGMGLAAPTILRHGPDATRARLLGPIVTGTETWCQLFSEPGNGSDLAGLATRAERDGDEWVVNGQKVWTTSAHHADLGLLLARTDWDVPKHRWITCFALPMGQPGVEVRPLRQMNGYSSFNEVFLSDARLPVDAVIGELGQGWAAALTTLAHERNFAGLRRPQFTPGRLGRAVEEARAEAAEYFKVYEWYPQRAGRADLVAEQAGVTGRADDPVARQWVADVEARRRVGQWTAERGRAGLAQGREPGAEGSLGKLSASVLARAAALAHGALAGTGATLTGADGAHDGLVAEILVSVPAVSIAGGTDEIQHTILGERMLGLPREPSVDRDLPFRAVPRNA